VEHPITCKSKMKALTVTAKNFLNYEFKSNGKYYTTINRNRQFAKTDFQKFYEKNQDCCKIIKSSNDAPRGGKTGNYLVVEFTEVFYERFGEFLAKKNEVKESESSFNERFEKSIEILKTFAKTNWVDLKQMSNTPALIKEALNLPTDVQTKDIKRVLYTKEK